MSARWGTAVANKPAKVVEPTKRRRTDDAPWTEQELADLRKLRADDTSSRLIALKLNRTKRAVEAKLLEMRASR